MSAIPRILVEKPGQSVELHSGDRMTQQEFHWAYEQAPDEFRAELIGGTVFVASPLRRRHGTNHLLLGSLFSAYEADTPGVEAGDNSTIILAKDAEPQPDLYLRILPEFGGQSRTTDDDYIDGAPELVLEVAHSGRAIDLHLKRADYTKHGVLEYLVYLVDVKQLKWFDLKTKKELGPDMDGVYRIRTFPGFWIDGQALPGKHRKRLMTTLEKGLATPEHTAFAAKLAGKPKKRRRSR
jgi:Uma2 family endonuclease